MQTRTGLGVDTCTYLPVEGRNAPPLRLHRLQATGTVTEWQPITTGSRPSWSLSLRAVFELRHEDAAPSRYNHGVEPAIATRGRRRPQRANSAQGAGRLRVATRGGRRTRRGWHTNREGWRAILVSHLPFWCPNPKHFAQTGCAPRVKRKVRRPLRVTTPSWYYGAALLRCCAVLHCCVTVRHPHRVTTESSHHGVEPHSIHRKVALRGTEVI